jgi:hypothetical protein
MISSLPHGGMSSIVHFTSPTKITESSPEFPKQDDASATEELDIQAANTRCPNLFIG